VRVALSQSIQREHSGLEDQLWAIGCHSKSSDMDIKLMGLHVRIISSKDTDHWSGWAYPEEESLFYNKALCHPAGRIQLTIGQDVTKKEIIRLFSHELRHIGQFHRGRKLFGFMTTHHMPETAIEQDCYDFEDHIIKKMGLAKCRGYARTPCKR
jgi:hypothetical protein